MRNLLFTLLMLIGSSMVMAQGTYYWVGTTPTTDYDSATGWNTAEDGSGTERTAYNAGDVLIVKGSGKEVQLNVTAADLRLAQLQVLDGAKVTLYNARSSGTGAWYFYLDGYVDEGNTSHKGLLVDNGSTFSLESLQAVLNVVLTKGGDINNSALINSPATTTIRLITKVAGGLVFDNGSICNFASAEGFGQGGVANPALVGNLNSAIEAVVFKSGTSLYHIGAGNPFAGGANPNAKFETGSNYYYQTNNATSGNNILKGRAFANLIMDGSYTAAGSEGFAKVDNLTIKSGRDFIYGGGTAQAQKVTGSVVVEGLLNIGTHSFIVDDLPAVPFTVETKSGSTVIVANAGGVDAAIVTTGTKTFDANTIYGFNAGSNDILVSALLPANVPTISGVVQIGGFIVPNNRIKLDKHINIGVNGKLYLNNNNSVINMDAFDLTLQPGVEIQSGGVNSRIWAHGTGVLTVKGITNATLIPISTNNAYTPVTLSAVNSSDFTLKAVAGLPLTPSFAPRVNGTYTITRTSGTGNFTTTLSWPATWETGGFAGLANNNISLYAYDALTSSYTIVPTSGADNTVNTVTATLSDGGTFIVGEGPNTLPVTLSAFTAQKQGNSALIKWTTSSENSSSHFNIERSTNGTDFTVIGSRKGAGTTSVAQYYSYTDYSPAGGTNYYRLVQYDLNGTLTITGPQVLNFNNNTQGLLVQTGQNIQEVAFYVNSATSGKAQVAVYAIDGKKVAQGTVNVDKGNNTCTLNTPSLGRGVYTLVYQLGNENYRAKFVK